MLDFFRLKNAIRPAREIVPEDAVATKTALAEPGHYQIPDFGMTPYPDGALFEGVRKFHREQGLEVDATAEQAAANARTLDGLLKSADDGALAQLFARALARQTPAAPTAEKIPASRHNDAINTTKD